MADSTWWCNEVPQVLTDEIDPYGFYDMLGESDPCSLMSDPVPIEGPTTPTVQPQAPTPLTSTMAPPAVPRGPGRKPKAPTKKPHHWLPYKDLVTKWYREEDKPAKEIVRILKDEHNFEVT
jgi:hypothetical protein